MTIQRGHIYLADLNPRRGTEPGKVRPVVVVQTDLLNQTGHPSTVICPLTTHIEKNAPLLRVHLPKGMGGVPHDSDIMADQIRAIDNRRLLRSLGKLPPKKMGEVLSNLKSLLDIEWL